MSAAAKPRLAETVIDPSVRLREAAIGARCEILKETSVSFAEIGDMTYLGEHCSVADATLGKYCAVADRVRIGAPNHPMERPTQHRLTYTPEYYDLALSRDHAFFERRRAARVVVGNDVWIGHAVTVLPGVVVGDGAVLAAGAVVSRNVAPYTVVGGVPAKPIRERFPRALAERLARIRWWDWPIETVLARLEAFRHDDVTAFCDRYDPA